MRKSFNKNGGITLIALVITIIVLLILAGVTIVSITGNNGLLERAQRARDETDKYNVIEQAKIDIFGLALENLDDSITKAQLKGVLDKYFKGVPSLEDLSSDEILNTELTTKDAYGNDKVKINEIYTGVIK